MSAYSDSFTGTDASSLGANWTKCSATNLTGDLAIYSNRAAGSVVNQWGLYTYASSVATSDQYAQVTVPIAASGVQREVQVGVRVKLPIVGIGWPDGYYIGVQYTTGSVNRYMFNYTGGSYQSMGSAATPAFTTGETIRIEAEGTTVRYLVNGSLAFQVSPDTNITGASNRLLAIACYGGSAANNGSAVDDFDGGDIGAAPVGQPAIKRFGGIPHMRRGNQSIW